MENIILQGDCIETLKQIPDGIVQCCVTSPPYWGLRDYGTAEWEGGILGCEHTGRTLGSNRNFVNESGRKGNNACISTGDCVKCGAKRVDNQLGLEETPEQFVDNLVNVFREVRRVLKDDGTVWLNLGDTYASSGNLSEGGSAKQRSNKGANNVQRKNQHGLKTKNLIGIPWKVAFALQADGWYLRQDIIWHKPNPMPESVTDRCTKAHEYIFLLTKSAKYFYDADAISEKSLEYGKDKRSDKGNIRYEGKRTQDESDEKAQQSFVTINKTRNRRSVWKINTKPFKEAHFAVFPPELPELCIKAGSKEGDIILDPFFGSGTTGVVAQKMNRKYLGCELNPEYIKLAERRLAQPAMF